MATGNRAGFDPWELSLNGVFEIEVVCVGDAIRTISLYDGKFCFVLHWCYDSLMIGIL